MGPSPTTIGSTTWKPLLDFLNANSSDYEGQDSFTAATLPARFFWDADAMRRVPGAIVSDPRPGAAPTDFWWTGDGETVGGFWNAYSLAARVLGTELFASRPHQAAV
jgi:hypothetical protein